MKTIRSFALAALWPVFVVGTTLGFAASFAWGFSEIGLALVPVVGIVLLFGFEWLLPDRRGKGAWRDPQAWNDVVHGVVGQGGGNALGQAVFVFAAAWLAGEIGERWGLRLWPAQWPGWVQVPLLIVVADGLDYWRHRLEHQLAWLWPIHALHHDIDRMNVLKSSRGHFLDMLFRNFVCYAPLALAGVPREVLLTYAAAITVFGPIAHANVSLRVPRCLHRLVLTPQVHRIHHARSSSLSCSNYANVFPLWDRLFGTFEHPDEHPRLDYGVEGERLPDDLIGQTWAPFATWRRRAEDAPANHARVAPQRPTSLASEP
jgi:sterol desaturase/sphingolipid hydroxylase (fatty acid hydroxylase superfamily)